MMRLDARRDDNDLWLISQVDGVLLVAPNATLLSQRRREFLRGMRDALTLSQDQRATSHKIATSLEQVKQEALSLRKKISDELSNVEEKCDVTCMGELVSWERCSVF